MSEQQVEQTPHEQLADARAELDELQGLIDGLEDQVREGDEREAQMRLGEAFGLKRLASLRREAAERKVARAEEQRREQERQETETLAATELLAVSLPRVAELYRQASEAVNALLDVCEVRERAVHDYGQKLHELGSEHLLYRGEGRTVLAFAGETFENHHFSPRMMLALLFEQTRRARKISDMNSRTTPDTHPVLRYLEAGEEL
ncbi:hypothetical protein [Streptomyces africanus]|uniref:hypothetical protein n=1 Tax=Streptomyces africanus TaxID=231024 RepID=UPI000A3CEDCF|nr:hypothetical protein [Streptomyces africanus]